MSNLLLGWPIYSDAGVTYTPTFNSGGWSDQLPLTNLNDARLAYLTRSLSVMIRDTRLRCDLGVDRQVGLLALPKHSISSAGKVRFLGVPSTMLFDYEAGDDVAALGGTFTRAPTATVLAATYVDSLGVLQYAGENRCLQSEVMGTTWTASNVTVATDSVAAPDDATTADTLTATAANGTLKQAVTTTAVSFTFSIWLKRLTGTGDVDITLDGTTWVTQTLTTAWQRFSVTQTGVAGTSNPGVRIVTDTDAVYAWGGQVEIGSTAKEYLPTTTAAVSAIRDGHYTSIGGSRSTLLEGARTNLCLQSEDFGTTWAANGSPTRSAAAHTASGVTLDLIGDDDGAGQESYSQAVTFTGDAVKAISVYVKEGTSSPASGSRISIQDTTAAASRLTTTITWSAGVPVPSASVGTYLGKQALAGGVYRLLFQTTSVTAANTNVVYVIPALNTTETGDIYVGGVQAEDATFPSSYIKTTTATVARAADALSFPITFTPQALTLYGKFTFGSLAADAATNYSVAAIGDTGTTGYFLARVNGSGLNGQAQHKSAAGTVTAGAANALVSGDMGEIRAVLASTGAATVGVSINGAAENVSAATAANALDAAWTSSTILLGSFGGVAQNLMGAIHSVRISAGVQTLATMQAVVYDSGWLDAWPSGATAEDLGGINHAIVAMPSSSQAEARYWSVQVDDTANATGYIDLHRLIVAGGYEPAINFSYGAKLGLSTATSKMETDGGASFYNVRAVRRSVQFILENVAEAEAFASPWKLQRQLGISGQLFFVFDQADTTLMHERAFLCVVKDLGTLEAVYLTRYGVPMSLIEEL